MKKRNFQGAKWLGNERARQRVGQGANRPESYWPIRSGERIGPGAKRLGTDFRPYGRKITPTINEITLKSTFEGHFLTPTLKNNM